jgi:MSHA pilin protein MshD
VSRHDCGFTLVELVIAIAVFAAAAAGVLLVFTETVGRSADPLIRVQARSIAEAYMDEITLKAYENPDDPGAENGNSGESGQDCGSGGSSNVSESGEDRATYDDVWDYHSINNEAPTTQLGTVADLGGSQVLADYTVDVKVNGNQAAGERARIIVCVTHTSGMVAYRLVSERWDYE